jgi:acetylornithine deacetylase/succinyl-diaminopimelate desuccinylase-like protein
VNIDHANALRILSDLIAIPTVNPMGHPYHGDHPVERDALNYIQKLFSPYAVDTRRSQCGPIHESLILTVPGECNEALTLLESHVDTVPAEDWLARAFQPRVDGRRVFGRGACDDKGCLTSMILAMLAILESGRKPPLPVVLLAAGDEELNQLGIKEFVAANPPLARAIVGEPTQCLPVVQHKGTIRWDIVITGRSAHSAQPELGIDAIQGAWQVCQALKEYQAKLRTQHQSPFMTGPTLTVTAIRGGRTRNAIADDCVLSVDFRIIPGMYPNQARDSLIAHLELLRLDHSTSLGRLGVGIHHREPQIATPALQTSPDDPFSQIVLKECREFLNRPELEFCAAPYCTDAAWVSDRCPTLVLGPGSIAQAHAVDEWIDLDEVVQCAKLYQRIVMTQP